ncbi:PIN domain of ribonuclease [anaerobic digester metagenome]
MTQNQSSPVIILDTSAFFISIPLSGRLMTVRKVVNELKDLRGKARLEILLSQGLIISEPGPDAIVAIQHASEKSGDNSVLSPTDLDLLALAFEFHGELYSDDFALQNTAQHLGIVVHPLIQKKAAIKTWKLRCAGCGAYYDTMPGDSLCKICGAQVRRKNK